MSLASKKIVGDYFSSCRGVENGINSGSVDFSLLRANKIYSWLDNIDALEDLIDENKSQGGWLIFYTHDITETPSRFGCQPAELDRLVSYAEDSGSRILSIRNALGALAFSI